MLYTYRWYYVYVRLCFLVAWRCQSGQQSRIAWTGLAQQACDGSHATFQLVPT